MKGYRFAFYRLNIQFGDWYFIPVIDRLKYTPDRYKWLVAIYWMDRVLEIAKLS